MRRTTRNWILVVLAVVGFALLESPVAAQEDDDYTPPTVAGVVVERPAPQPVAKTGTDSMAYVRVGVAAIALGTGLVLLSRHRRRSDLTPAVATQGDGR